MSFEAGTLVARLTLDFSEYTHGILEAEGLTEVFGHTIAHFVANPLLGVTELAKEGAHGLLDMAEHGLEAAHKMELLEKQTGLTQRQIAGLGEAARASGSTLDDVIQGVGLLNRKIFEVASGSATENPFEALHIDIGRLGVNLRSASELMPEIAERIANMKTHAEQAGAATQLFGRSAAGLIPMLSLGSAGLREFEEEAQAFGLILGHDVQEKLSGLSGALKTFPALLEGLELSFVTGLVEGMVNSGTDLRHSLLDISAALRPLAHDFGDWIGRLLPTSDEVKRLSQWINDDLVPSMRDLLKWVENLIVAYATWKGVMAGIQVGTPFGPIGQIVGGLAVGTAAYASASNLVNKLDALLEQRAGSARRGQSGDLNVKVDVDGRPVMDERIKRAEERRDYAIKVSQ